MVILEKWWIQGRIPSCKKSFKTQSADRPIWKHNNRHKNPIFKMVKRLKRDDGDIVEKLFAMMEENLHWL